MRLALQRPPGGSAVNWATTEAPGLTSVVRSFGGFCTFFFQFLNGRGQSSPRQGRRSTIFQTLESTTEQKSRNEFGFAPFDGGIFDQFESLKEGERPGKDLLFPALEDVKANE